MVTKACPKCRRDLPATLEFFYKNGDRLQGQCKECQTASHRAWVAANPGRAKSSQKEWRDRNRDYLNTKRRETRRSDIDSWRERDRDRRAAIRREVLAAYGGKCACCGETHPEFLAIDHINNDGADHRKEVKSQEICRWLKRNGFPKEGFQLLCHNCNLAKAHYGGCPHQGPVSGISTKRQRRAAGK